MTTNFRIFFTYLKIGFMAFGGGYTMLPILEREFVVRKKWFSHADLVADFSLASSLPGFIAVNTALLLGYRLRGAKGGFAAALGVVIPSILVITIIALFFQDLASFPWLQKIFRGLNIAIIVLLLSAVLKLWRQGVRDLITFLIFAITALCYALTSLSPAFFILGGAISGLLLAGRSEK